MPIRGHSGVQGGAEMGALRDRACPAALPINAAERGAAFGAVGLRGAGGAGTDRAGDDRRGRTRASSTCCSAAGGNFLEALPDPDYVPTRRSARCRCGSIRTSCCPARCWSTRPRRVLLLPAATRYEMPRRGHRNLDRAPDHVQPRDRGPPDRRGAAGVGGLRRARRAGCARSWPSGSASPGTHAIREEIARVVPIYDGIQHLRKTRRSGPVRRRAICARMDGSRHARRQGALLRGRLARSRSAPDGHVRGRHPARQAVQQHGPASEGRAHRRGPRGGADQPRRRRPARPGRRRLR